LKVLSAISLLSVLAVTLVVWAGGRHHDVASTPWSAPPENSATGAKAVQRLGKLPLRFEKNVGQADRQVRFLSRQNGYTLFLTSSEAVLGILPGKKELPPRANTDPPAQLMRMKLIGAHRAARAAGENELPGTSNYLIGNDPTKWHVNVPSYESVRYKDIYPGIDMVYYGHDGQLEYDFVVAPGADAGSITVAFDTASLGKHLDEYHRAVPRVQEGGDLLLQAHDADIRFHKPVIYQPASATTPESRVDGCFRITNSKAVRFELGAYDHSRELVIDPAVGFSTFIGGSQNDYGYGIAVDATGNVYIGGQTFSPDFPISSDAHQSGCGGGDCALGDGFITKLNSTGSDVIYSTYFGGRNRDLVNGLAVDAANNIYVTGQTYSPDFPTTKGAFQTLCGGRNCRTGEGFVAEIDASGASLIYSSFIGGSAYDQGNAIALDTVGNAYIVGTTCSSDFPVTSGAFQTAYGGDSGGCNQAVPAGDAFVAEVNAGGSSVNYATYVGGSYGDVGYAIALDQEQNAYITGYTDSTNFPTSPNAFQTQLGSGAPAAAYITKLDPAGAVAVYSTYLGGTGNGIPCDACGTAIALDSQDNAYVVGLTLEKDFPTTAGSIQPAKAAGGGHDAFVAEMNQTGSALVYSTFLGGTADDGATSIELSAVGTVYVRGNTFSFNFPVTANAYQKSYAGDTDAFVTVFIPTVGSKLQYSSYLGGSGREWGEATAMLALSGARRAPNVYVTGLTSSTDFPTTAGAFQVISGGSNDAFVTEFTFGAKPSDQFEETEFWSSSR